MNFKIIALDAAKFFLCVCMCIAVTPDLTFHKFLCILYLCLCFITHQQLTANSLDSQQNTKQV